MMLLSIWPTDDIISSSIIFQLFAVMFRKVIKFPSKQNMKNTKGKRERNPPNASIENPSMVVLSFPLGSSPYLTPVFVMAKQIPEEITTIVNNENVLGFGIE